MKVGDKVFEYKNHRSIPSVEVITGETKTCWRIRKQSLYYKEGYHGLRGGGDWCTAFIAEYDEDEEIAYAKNRKSKSVAQKLSSMNLHTLSNEKLIAIGEIIWGKKDSEK